MATRSREAFTLDGQEYVEKRVAAALNDKWLHAGPHREVEAAALVHAVGDLGTELDVIERAEAGGAIQIRAELVGELGLCFDLRAIWVVAPAGELLGDKVDHTTQERALSEHAGADGAEARRARRDISEHCRSEPLSVQFRKCVVGVAEGHGPEPISEPVGFQEEDIRAIEDPGDAMHKQ